MNLLAKNLNAAFIEQKTCLIKPIDKINAMLWGTAKNWSFARSLASQLQTNDVVFCPGEGIGIPLAHICSSRKVKPKIIVWFHRITGLRTSLALKLFNIDNSVDLAVVSSSSNKKFLHNYLNFPKDRVLFWRHAADCDYFKSYFKSANLNNKIKPIIASVGLEKRDYRLLASATEKLEVDVKVAGFSQFQSRVAKSFPEVLPKNMTNRKYEWFDLLQLYYDADIVVIPLKENKSAAGITTLLEAMACKKPIICVRTQGLAEYLTDEEAVITVKPGDILGLKAAILYLLNNPEEAKLRGDRAYQLAWSRHNLDNQVEVLAEFIKTTVL